MRPRITEALYKVSGKVEIQTWKSLAACLIFCALKYASAAYSIKNNNAVVLKKG